MQLGARGGAVVEAMRYEPIPDGVTGFFIDIILPVALWPWVDSASNRNE
jgi:hypothetical protein